MVAMFLSLRYFTFGSRLAGILDCPGGTFRYLLLPDLPEPLCAAADWARCKRALRNRSADAAGRRTLNAAGSADLQQERTSHVHGCCPFSTRPGPVKNETSNRCAHRRRAQDPSRTARAALCLASTSTRSASGCWRVMGIAFQVDQVVAAKRPSGADGLTDQRPSARVPGPDRASRSALRSILARHNRCSPDHSRYRARAEEGAG